MISSGKYKILRFLLIGGAAALGYFGIATFLKFLGMPIFVAGSFAFLIMLPFSYMGHRLFTFGSERDVLPELQKFALSAAMGAMLSGAIPYLSVSRFHLPVMAGFSCACILVPTLNYLLLNLWVFANGGRRGTG